MIKPIETSYKGYRFRSRLEARWAVYFDAVGLRWEYEKEGFNLPSGACYLPDFWLPDAPFGGCWAECKPAPLTPGERGLAIELARSGRDVLILEGVPSLAWYEMVSRYCVVEEDADYLGKVPVTDSIFHRGAAGVPVLRDTVGGLPRKAAICVCGQGHLIGVSLVDITHPNGKKVKVWGRPGIPSRQKLVWFEKDFDSWVYCVSEGVSAARSARFEHKG